METALIGGAQEKTQWRAFFADRRIYRFQPILLFMADRALFFPLTVLRAVTDSKIASLLDDTPPAPRRL